MCMMFAEMKVRTSFELECINSNVDGENEVELFVVFGQKNW